MKRILMIILLLGGMSLPSCFADTIYLKNGKILEGKLKENTPSPIRDEWCSGEEEIELIQGTISQCLRRVNIEKVETPHKEVPAVALLAINDQWGPEENGYRTQLIPASEEFIIGQPVKVHLVMKNVSDKIKWYDVQGISRALRVNDSTGQPVMSKQAIVQTLGAEQPIDPGEIVVLFEDKDITKDFVITRPGSYTLQSARGNYGFSSDTIPVSNVLTIQIKPGQVNAEDYMIDALTKVLPDKTWQVTPGWGKFPNGPAGWLAEKPVEVQMVKSTGKDKELLTIQVWQTSEDAVPDPNVSRKSASEFLGQDIDGKYYYALIPMEAVEPWLTAREDIIHALAIVPPVY